MNDERYAGIVAISEPKFDKKIGAKCVMMKIALKADDEVKPPKKNKAGVISRIVISNNRFADGVERPKLAGLVMP